MFGCERIELKGIDKLEVDNDKAYLWFTGQIKRYEIERSNIKSLNA